MAQKVGDLYPHASGSSSLGVEQIGGPDSGHTTDVRPFNHIHMNSGILHDPLHGTSGVFRYDNDRGMELSLDGGITFKSFVTDLQTAYNGGNNVTLRCFPTPSFLVGSLFKTSHDGVVLGTRTPGAGMPSDGSELQQQASAHIIASGFTLTPNLRNTYQQTGIGPGFLYIQGSGTPSFKPPYFSVLTASNGPSIAGDFVIMTTSGTFICNSAGSLTFNVGGQGATDMLFNNLAGSNGVGGQITFKPFAGSGQLQYLMGPYESWHQANSSDFGTFHPIPHSGQILQMILENGGGGGITNLQEAYEGGNTITTVTADGAVTVVGNTEDALHLSSLEQSVLNLSGVFAPGAGKVNQGDIWFARHQLTPEHNDLPGIVGDQDGGNGLAGGTPTLFLHTGGSGITSVRVASGIAQFFNIPATDFDRDGAYADFRNAGQVAKDRHFRAINGSGVAVWAEGCYRCTYSASIEKTDGNLMQGVEANIHIGGKQGQLYKIAGGESFCQLRDSAALNGNTANGQAVMDVFAGEVVNIRVRTTEIPVAPNQVRIASQGTSMILEFLGPIRGTSNARSPTTI